jgi:hypothetical protein
MEIEKPFTVRHSYRQRLTARPEKVFPLLCPVREADWVDGWDPPLVLSNSGVIEPGCIFITPGDEGSDAVWVTTRHDPTEFEVEFVKVTPGTTVARIEIQLEDAPDGGTFCYVSYAYTALSEAGRNFVESFTEDRYETFMGEWETALNYYLANGSKLPSIGGD